MITGLILYAAGMTLACVLMAMALHARREQLRSAHDRTIVQQAEIGHLRLQNYQLRLRLQNDQRRHNALSAQLSALNSQPATEARQS